MFEQKHNVMRTILFLFLLLTAAIGSVSSQSLQGPAICFGGLINNDTISVDYDLTAMELRICNDTEGLITVSSFQMTRYCKGCDPTEKNQDGGNKLNSEMIGLIQKSPAGSKFYFEYVKGVRKSGRHIPLGTLLLIKK